MQINFYLDTLLAMKKTVACFVLAAALVGACGSEVELPAPQCEERDVWVCSDDTDLRSLDLHGAQLSFAELDGVNLQGVNLEGARLDNADLSHANLEGANLSNARLDKANLSHANLAGADLTWAELTGADLSYANLEGTILDNAKMRNADTTGFTGQPTSPIPWAPR